MKLLLDENLPKRLKNDFPEHEIYTVRDQGWNELRTNWLLKRMVMGGFDALITFDKHLQNQRNFRKCTLTVFVLSASDNTYLTLTQLAPKINLLLQENLVAGPVIIQE